MMDTHETNLPVEENGKLEETKAQVTTPENTVETTETATEEVAVVTGKLSKEEILEKLTSLVEATTTDAIRNEVEVLKQTYYKIHRNEVDELKKAFLENGGEEKDFIVPVDETENKLKEL